MKEIRLRTKLKSATLHIDGAEKLVGKDVEVTIREIAQRKPSKRSWAFIGKASITGTLDNNNIRDLAYE